MLGVVLGEALPYAFEDPAAVEFLRGLAGAGIALHLVPATGGEGDAALVLDAAVDAFVLYSLPDGHPLVEAVAAPAGCRWSSRAGRELAGLPARGDRRARGRRGGGGAPARARPHAAGGAEPAVLARRPRRPAAARRVPAHRVTRGRLEGYGVDASGARWQLNDRAHGEAAAGALLDGPEPPTGLLCMSDELAIGALRAAAARGLVVPARAVGGRLGRHARGASGPIRR